MDPRLISLCKYLGKLMSFFQRALLEYVQARFLLAKLNPSATYHSDAPLVPGGDILFTDDVSFEVFLDHLQRLAVQ